MKNKKALSLIEVLVTSLISVIVVGGTVFILAFFTKMYNDISSTIIVRKSAEIVHDTIFKDISQAASLSVTSSSVLVITNNDNSQIRYRVADNRLFRDTKEATATTFQDTEMSLFIDADKRSVAIDFVQGDDARMVTTNFTISNTKTNKTGGFVADNFYRRNSLN